MLCVTQIHATVDIVAVSETWLTDSDSGNLFELNGYISVHIPGKYNKGGGVSLYIGNHLYLNKLNALSQVIENVMETVFLKSTQQLLNLNLKECDKLVIQE